MASLESYYDNLKIEEEKKIPTSNGNNLESFYQSLTEQIPQDQITQNQDLSAMQTVGDISVSGVSGAGKGFNLFSRFTICIR
jgi:hypothetical protein